MPENMLGNTTYVGRDGRKYPLPAWKSLGFLVCPTLTTATGAEKLYRVYSAAETGRFFSRTPYRTRREAERHTNVMQYGNGILLQSEFSVEKGTPMWIGTVDPGDFAGHFDTVAGSQVFIDFEYLGKGVRKVRDLKIIDDMNGAFVIDNKDRGQLNS